MNKTKECLSRVNLPSLGIAGSAKIKGSDRLFSVTGFSGIRGCTLLALTHTVQFGLDTERLKPLIAQHRIASKRLKPVKYYESTF